MHYNYKKRQMLLDGPGNSKDYISINERDKFIDYLEEDKIHTGKGGNSFIFRLKDCNQDEDDQVIKICKYYEPSPSTFYYRRIERFEREIAALNNALESEKNNYIIKILCDGAIENRSNKFRYYVMEMAEYDLRDYLSSYNFSIQGKIQLCYQIVDAFRTLHELGIYHRDIKPENILFVDDQWKIGDLGLVSFREEDIDIDDKVEKIGPYGYLSPEAVNKALGNREINNFTFDCVIDDKSDVFQIAKVLWYILQGEVPTGQLIQEDFKHSDNIDIFEKVIMPSLQFAKLRRPNIKELWNSLLPICKELAII